MDDIDDTGDAGFAFTATIALGGPCRLNVGKDLEHSKVIWSV
jgi:hypothetical protein